MGESGSERRRSDRFRVAEAFVEFSDLGLLAKLKRATGTRVLIEDLGLLGLRMRTDSELKPGKGLSVRITVSFLPEPIETRATVIWCRSIPRAKRFRIGLRFDERTDAFRAWMQQFEEKVADLPIPVRCPHCAHVFRARRWLVGRSAKCGQCGQTIQALVELIEGEPTGQGLRSAESVLEALDDMAGAQTGVVKGSVLHPRIQHFLMKYVRGPIHLALVEYLHGRDGSPIDTRQAAQTINCRESELVKVCEDFCALDILKRRETAAEASRAGPRERAPVPDRPNGPGATTGRERYLYDPDMVARRDVNDFMRDFDDPDTRAKVLAFVLTAGEQGLQRRAKG